MSLHLTNELKRALENDPKKCILFVGAGLSSANVREASKGLPTWQKLIKAMIDDLKDAEKCDENTLEKLNNLYDKKDYLEIAQVFKERTRPDQYSAFLKELLDPDDLTNSKIHEIILSIGFRGIITTNFDCIFETQSNIIQPLIYPQGFEDIMPFRKSGFFSKIHGCIRNTPNLSKNLILSKESYIALRSNPKYQTLLRSLIVLHPLLTVGFSLTDPDFIGLIEDLKENLGESMPTIYSLMLTKDGQLRDNWRKKGVEIIPYEDHAELLSFFRELKLLAGTKNNKIDPNKEVTEIDYDKFLNVWKHVQKQEELFRLIKKQIDALQLIKEKEIFIFKLTALIGSDNIFFLAPHLVELKTPSANRLLISLFTRLESEDKWWRIEPDKLYLKVHKWLLENWTMVSNSAGSFYSVDFKNSFDWLLNSKWENLGIDLEHIFTTIFDQILSNDILWKLDELYSACGEINGTPETIEQTVLKKEFVRENDKDGRWYKSWFERTQENVRYLKFERKVRKDGSDNYEKQLKEAFSYKDYRYNELILKRIIDNYTHYTHLSLHGSSDLYDPNKGRQILETLSKVTGKENQLRVLWAINRFPERNRGLGSLGEDNKNLREGLFYPLWWRYSNETRIEYGVGSHKHKMHSLSWDTGQEFLLKEFFGLSYDIDKDFVQEFNHSLEKHRSDKKVYEKYEPRPLQELWRYRELKYQLSNEIPPEMIRRIAVFRVDWDNLQGSETRWKEAKIKAEKTFSSTTINKYFSKKERNYVLDNLLGSYQPDKYSIILYPCMIEKVANDLDIDSEALGTVAYIHLTIHAYCHIGKDLNNREWLDFSLPQHEQPIFKLSPIHETIAQYYTNKLIKKLQDDEIEKAFLEFEKSAVDVYKAWRKVENYTLEKMRSVLIKYRRLTHSFELE